MSHFITTLFGDEELPTKKCSKCKQHLPLSSFSRASGGNYLRGECKACNNKLAKQRKAIIADSPPDDYLCPICKRNADQVEHRGGKNNGPWVKDHDHDSGKFREWLCHDCNRGLGAFNDDLELLCEAVEYTRKHLNGGKTFET